MKRTIKLAVVAALALGATSAFATNGATMIGYGAKSFGMGGTGIGVSHGAESALANPAMITSVEGSEVSFGGTVFMPEIETTHNAVLSDGAGGYVNTSGSAESESDMFMIPSVSLATKVNDNFYWGIGMWGTGGLGVDFRNDDSHMNMVTALQLMQFGVPLVYTTNNFSIGITPILQYGSLDINYVMSADLLNNFAAMGGDMSWSATNPSTVGSGVRSDMQFGYSVGLGYETNGITLGAVYKSEIEMEYDGVMSTAIGAMTQGNYTNDKLSVPAEYGVGVSYTMQGHTLAVDYKNIAWSDAEGYKDFGWEDQDVIAIGYEFATDGWALRAGYQYAEAAVQDNTGKNLALDQMVPNLTNTFNTLGFPGTAESHVTIGGTYAFNEKISLDLAYVRALETEETYTNFLSQDTTIKHTEDAYSFQVNFAF